MPELAYSQQQFFLIFAVGCLCAWILLELLQLPKREREAYAFVRELSNKLSQQPFFHSLKRGERRHFAGTQPVWSDGSYLLIVKEKEVPIAMIGFSLSRGALSVVQLQGIPGANFRGRNVGMLLLPHAELLARTLGKSYIRVQAACLHTYFHLDEESRLYPKLFEHQERLRKIYDQAPEALGYEPEYWLGAIPWRRKRLRKRITLARFLRMQELRYDRAMLKLARSGSVEYLQSE